MAVTQPPLLPQHRLPTATAALPCLPFTACRRSSKIATRKGKADAQKSKLYGKIGKQVAQAVRQGGPDVLANSRLKDALHAAKMAQVRAVLCYAMLRCAVQCEDTLAAAKMVRVYAVLCCVTGLGACCALRGASCALRMCVGRQAARRHWPERAGAK